MRHLSQHLSGLTAECPGTDPEVIIRLRQARVLKEDL
jgi:hypothetical protein